MSEQSSGGPGPDGPGFRFAWANRGRTRWLLAFALIACMPVGLVVGAIVGVAVVLIVAGRHVTLADGSSSADIITITAMSGMVAPIGVAAVLGGLALHRRGWIAGVLFYAASVCAIASGGVGRWALWVAGALMVAAIVSYTVFGVLSGALTDGAPAPFERQPAGRHTADRRAAAKAQLHARLEEHTTRTGRALAWLRFRLAQAGRLAVALAAVFFEGAPD